MNGEYQTPIQTLMQRVLGNILCNIKVKVKRKKAGICDGVPSTEV